LTAAIIKGFQGLCKATERARQAKEDYAFDRHSVAINNAKQYLADHPSCGDRALARWLTENGFKGDAHHFVRLARKKNWL
jgi:hypothetical protein